MQFAQKIAPCLWFESQAEEAAKFYIGIFKNFGKIRGHAAALQLGGAWIASPSIR